MIPTTSRCQFCGASFEEPALVCPQCQTRQAGDGTDAHSGGGLWLLLGLLAASLLGVLLKLLGLLG